MSFEFGFECRCRCSRDLKEEGSTPHVGPK